ncbi:MAG: fibronectin type III domain-containing protein [Comamonadaceae bacterium]|nr:fibronectin type III domain-containing protein [Comamonadaceae bacterium]
MNVAGLTTGVTAIAAGFEHTCALKGGQVSCWGSNQYGQIGTGNTLPAPMPQVVITENATAITAGGAHTCAIVGLGGRDPTKVVKCWGLNYWGQIGDNSTTDRLSPVEVFSSDTIAIAAGGSHTCLIAKVNPPFDSVTKCWGYNNKGQIGDGTINVHPKVPTNVQGLYGATAISVGGEHTCAIVGTNRSLRCWGLNAFGQVTDADTDREPLPVTLADTGVDKVAASSYHTCALASGGVTCWGWNYLGQLGDGKSGISPQTVLVTWPPPDPPTLVRLQPIDQGMRVYFTPPASDNGTDIDSYTATCTPTGGTPVSLTGTTSPLTVTGLVNGVSYLCTVSATSTAGTSSASGAMTRVVRKGDLTPILMLLLD